MYTFVCFKGQSLVVVRNILKDVSHVLEAMADTAGVQSFILAVNPLDPFDMGFLGGSLLGREFWRGLRNGGEQGARAFKTTCFNRLPKTTVALPVKQTTLQATSHTPSPGPTPTSAPSQKAGTSKSIKTDLYENVRTALRCACVVLVFCIHQFDDRLMDIEQSVVIVWPR